MGKTLKIYVLQMPSLTKAYLYKVQQGKTTGETQKITLTLYLGTKHNQYAKRKCNPVNEIFSEKGSGYN